ncbi:MAG TPA: hypothetical protein DCY13_14660 [Verrucomicrobiales bacterium]|nr:hypothetical protein [Verrucomicrobiales bacterium]
MSSAPYVHRHRITYAECTIGNHVYYSRYLDLLEEARGEWFRSFGWPLLQLQTEDIAFPVTEAHLEYAAPARYDDLVRIELWVMALTRLRLQVGFAVRDESGSSLVNGQTHHVCTSVSEKPRRMPVELFNALRRYEQPVGTTGAPAAE